MNDERSGVHWPAEFEIVLQRHLLHFADEQPLEPETLLVECGLDSMTAITLMLDLETTLGVRFSEDALTSKAFATPASLWSATREAIAGSTEH